MSDSLSKFLINLASSPDLMKRFLEDPQATLADAGLSAEEEDAILTRDAARLRKILKAGIGGLGGIRIIAKAKAKAKPASKARRAARKTKKPAGKKR